MENHQLINATSGKVEYWTPLCIVDAARDTMGGIDLDPASSQAANDRIMAARFFTEEQDGLKQPWEGRVWMNHPFGRKSNLAWIAKLISEYELDQVGQACCITYACTSERWFYPLTRYPQCFLRGRTNFLLPDGTVKKGVTKGSVVTYLGPRLAAFAYHFREFGRIKIALN